MADTIATLQAVITAETAGFEKGLASAKKGMGGFGAAAGAAMSIATKAIDIAIGAIEGIGEASIGAAIKFDKSLKNIQAVSGQTSAEIKALGGELMNIGAHSVAGTQAVADAYYDVASGVTNAGARMATLKAAVALSEAGNASLASSTQALISVMNSYSFSAEKAGFASDVLTRTVGLGVGTMEQFGGALGPISGIAAKVGVKFEELGASAAFLTTKGASASQAATRLQAAMVSMLNPNTQMTAALRKAGFASGEAAIKQLGLAGAMNALLKASGGSTEAMAKMAGSVEALQAMAALAGPEFADFAKQFADGMDGATAAAQKVQLGSFDAQWKLFTNSLGTAAQAVGMMILPALNSLISFFNNAIGVVGKFGPQISAALSKVTGIFQPLIDEVNRVTGPLQSELFNIATAFSTFFGKLYDEQGQVIQGDSIADRIVRPVKTAQEKLGPAFDQLKYVVGEQLKKIAAAFNIDTGAISAGWGRVQMMFDGVSSSIRQFIDKLSGLDLSGPKKIFDIIASAIGSLATTVGGAVMDAVLSISENLPRLGGGIKSFGDSLAGADYSGVKAIVDGLAQVIGKLVEIGGAIVSGAVAGIADALPPIGSAIKQFNDALSSAVKGDWGTALSGLGTGLGNLASGLAKIPEGIATKIGGIFNIDVQGGLAAWKTIPDQFVTIFTQIGTNIGNAIINLPAQFQQLVDGIKTAATNFVNNAISGIASFGHDFGFAIADNLKSINIGAAATDLLNGASKIATDIINSAVSGIKGLADGLIAAITAELDKVIAGIQAKGAEIGAAIASAITGKAVTTNGGVKTGAGVGVGFGSTGGQRASGGAMNMMPALAGALQGQDTAPADSAALTAQLQSTLDAAVAGLQPPAGLGAKLASFFSGADITASLTNLGTLISASLATTFGADGVVMTALQPFAEGWALMFGAGGAISTAATGMQGIVDALVGSIVNISGTGTPAILEFQAVSTSAAPTIADSWRPVVGVFQDLQRTLEGIAGAAQRATSAMGAVPGVGGVAGARAGGGAVARGQTYLVGENGPELFTAKSNGQIIPNGGSASVGGSGGMTITGPINIYGVQNANQMYDQIARVARNRNA